jgi:hypothetical protein
VSLSLSHGIGLKFTDSAHRWTAIGGRPISGESRRDPTSRSTAAIRMALLERLVPDSSRVFLDDVENDAFAAAVRPVAE